MSEGSRSSLLQIVKKETWMSWFWGLCWQPPLNNGVRTKRTWKAEGTKKGGSEGNWTRWSLPEVWWCSDLFPLFPNGLSRKCFTLTKARDGMVIKAFALYLDVHWRVVFLPESLLFSCTRLIIVSLALRGYALPHCRFKLALGVVTW